MGWTVFDDLEAGLVCARAEGTITSADVAAQIVESTALLVQRGFSRALADYSKASLAMSLEEVAEIPALLDEAGFPREAYCAIVVPASASDMHKYTFFDEAANTRGYRVQLFWEMTSATRWLALRGLYRHT